MRGTAHSKNSINGLLKVSPIERSLLYIPPLYCERALHLNDLSLLKCPRIKLSGKTYRNRQNQIKSKTSTIKDGLLWWLR